MMNKLNTIKEKAINKAVMAVAAAKNKIEETRGSVSEHAIVIIIGVVLGGILLVGLIALMNNVIMPSTEDKVTSMFNMG